MNLFNRRTHMTEKNTQSFIRHHEKFTSRCQRFYKEPPKVLHRIMPYSLSPYQVGGVEWRKVLQILTIGPFPLHGTGPIQLLVFHWANVIDNIWYLVFFGITSVQAPSKLRWFQQITWKPWDYLMVRVNSYYHCVIVVLCQWDGMSWS